jgi:hypothetical protein
VGLSGDRLYGEKAETEVVKPQDLGRLCGDLPARRLYNERNSTEFVARKPVVLTVQTELTRRPDDLGTIEELFQRAPKAGREQRPAFLDQACGGREELPWEAFPILHCLSKPVYLWVLIQSEIGTRSDY